MKVEMREKRGKRVMSLDAALKTDWREDSWTLRRLTKRELRLSK